MKRTNISTPVTPDELWRFTEKALDNGDFTRLSEFLAAQNASVISLLESNGEQKEYMDEAFTWACFEGRTEDAKVLLDMGVDPTTGFKTGLAGFHWAVNRGHTETVKMLIERNAPFEQVNIYGGTVLNCALYSIVHENKSTHAEIIELLVEAGAQIQPGTLEWWEKQSIPLQSDKDRVASVLKQFANL